MEAEVIARLNARWPGRFVGRGEKWLSMYDMYRHCPAYDRPPILKPWLTDDMTVAEVVEIVEAMTIEADNMEGPPPERGMLEEAKWRHVYYT